MSFGRVASNEEAFRLSVNHRVARGDGLVNLGLNMIHYVQADDVANEISAWKTQAEALVADFSSRYSLAVGFRIRS